MKDYKNLLSNLRESLAEKESNSDPNETSTEISETGEEITPVQETKINGDLRTKDEKVKDKFSILGETFKLPNVSSEDSLFYRIESLRNYLEMQLGTSVFVQVYNLLKDLREQDDDEELNLKVKELLPGDKINFLSLINQLIYCEEAIIHAERQSRGVLKVVL